MTLGLRNDLEKLLGYFRSSIKSVYPLPIACENSEDQSTMKMNEGVKLIFRI